ncbi:MAG: TIGR03032 family protein, partial [Cyanobacteria bacterium P01_F01_bin.86]
KKCKKLNQVDFNLFDIFNQKLSASQQQKLANLRASSIENNICLSRKNIQSSFKRRSKRTIHLGYISSDFRDHPIGNLVQQLFKLHDREKFTVYCYSIGPNDSSKYRENIEEDCDYFYDVSRFSYTKIASLIRKSSIDILIDLNGYTAHSRPEIFMIQSAPIQINYLGNPGTMGTKNIQYIITNKTITPPEQERYISEKCIFLPNCRQVTNDRQTLNFKEMALKNSKSNNSFIYCCFNRVEKIDSVVFNIWMNILSRVPNSALWLLRSNPYAENNLKQYADDYGIDSKRLVFINPLSKNYLLEKQAAVDLFLDTLYFNASATAINSLWVGVPVLTLPGETFMSRVGASLLMGVDMPELIASSLIEYEDIAVDFAQNPSKLSLLRRKLINQRFNLPLFKVSRTVKLLEKGYLQAWQNHLNGRLPVSLNVEE